MLKSLEEKFKEVKASKSNLQVENQRLTEVSSLASKSCFPIFILAQSDFYLHWFYLTNFKEKQKGSHLLTLGRQRQVGENLPKTGRHLLL